MLITLTPCDTGRREEVALQIQEVAPTDSRGGPHHVCGVALYSVWHFALCGEWILEVAPTDSRGGPHHVYDVALCSVWHLVPFRNRRTLARLWDTSSSSRHQACSVGRRNDCAINKSNSAGDMSAGDTGVQECRSIGDTGVQEYKSTGDTGVPDDW